MDLRQAYGSNDGKSHALLQRALAPDVAAVYGNLTTQAAGIRHIGYGPLKKVNQDEYFVQVGGFAGQQNGCLYCVFDGHGTYGGNAAHFCCRNLPKVLSTGIQDKFREARSLDANTLNDVMTNLIRSSFLQTEAQLRASGTNINSSGTTASVIYQEAHLVWVASVGDSRAISIQQQDGKITSRALTIDHRPARNSEKRRVEAAGGRVEPKKLPSGQVVGEPRLWLQDLPTPGLMLSRSIGDDMATSIGCTADPEVVFLTLKPGVDRFLVVASDGIWDVLTNEQVSQLVVEAGEPGLACQHVLEAALHEWEERLAADNISMVCVMFNWELPASSKNVLMVVTGDDEAEEAAGAAGVAALG